MFVRLNVDQTGNMIQTTTESRVSTHLYYIFIFYIYLYLQKQMYKKTYVHIQDRKVCVKQSQTP